ncbi:MAG: ABC transporter permease [Bauldia sp.]
MTAAADFRPARPAGFFARAEIVPSVIHIMWKREMQRYRRDRSQIFGGLSRTILWLMILGYGLGAALREVEGYSYSVYVLPGVVVLNVLFASLQCAISLVYDRHVGLLREVMVSPAPILSVTLGKLFGGATISVLQGTIPLLFAMAASLFGMAEEWTPPDSMPAIAIGIGVVFIVGLLFWYRRGIGDLMRSGNPVGYLRENWALNVWSTLGRIFLVAVAAGILVWLATKGPYDPRAAINVNSGLFSLERVFPELFSFDTVLTVVLSWIVMFFLGILMTAIGVIIASRLKTFEGFGAISNGIIQPLYFLSGSIFPLRGAIGGAGFTQISDATREALRREGVSAISGSWFVQLPVWIQVLVFANPVSYALDVLRYIIMDYNQLNLTLDFSITFALPLVAIIIAAWAMNRMLKQGPGRMPKRRGR